MESRPSHSLLLWILALALIALAPTTQSKSRPSQNTQIDDTAATDATPWAFNGITFPLTSTYTDLTMPPPTVISPICSSPQRLSGWANLQTGMFDIDISDDDDPGPMAAQTHETPLAAGSAIGVTVGLVLESETCALLLASLGLMGYTARRRMRETA